MATTARKKTAKKSAAKKPAAKKRPAAKTAASRKKKTASPKKSASAKKTSGSAKKKAGSTRKYGPKASDRVGRELREMKRGKLKSGSGKKVTNRKQAIAIGLSEARRGGGKVPPNPNARKKKPS